jgi:hypothetical protein
VTKGYSCMTKALWCWSLRMGCLCCALSGCVWYFCDAQQAMTYMLDRLSFSNGFYSFKLGVGIFTGLDFTGCLISQALAGICRLGHRCSSYLYLLLKSNNHLVMELPVPVPAKLHVATRSRKEALRNAKQSPSHANYRILSSKYSIICPGLCYFQLHVILLYVHRLFEFLSCFIDRFRCC